MRVLENYNIKKHSNMRVGGSVKKFIEIEDRSELEEVLKNSKNYFILGNGTNTLFGDNFIDIEIISLKKLCNILYLGENKVKVEAGLDFGRVIRFMEEHNLSGIEELSGIPGTLGGLVYMNGGAYGREIFDFIESIEILDENRNIRTVLKEDLEIGYRNTEIKEKGWIILSATFKFNTGFKKDLAKEVRAKRESNQPLEMPNLGSTFKNPKGNFAARLIIDAGIQGLKIGGAQVSMKHPNFIVNDGTATASDVMNLVKKVQEKVKANSGIELEREIIILK